MLHEDSRLVAAANKPRHDKTFIWLRRRKGEGHDRMYLLFRDGHMERVGRRWLFTQMG